MGSAALTQAAQTITAADMDRRIGALAADSMRGRDTPSPELEKAARYLTEEFRRMGLQPAGDSATFIQRFPYVQGQMDPEATFLRLRGHEAASPRFGTDFFLITGPAPRAEGPVFHAGEAGRVTSLPAEAAGSVVLFDLPGAELNAEWQGALTAALGVGIPAGATAIGFVLDPAFSSAAVGQLTSMVAGQQAPVPVFGVTRRSAEAMFAQAAARPGMVQPPARVAGAVIEVGGVRSTIEHRVPNVVALLPGSDPVLRDTYVVLTAHFDHVGVGAPDASGDSIYNGADDNASGTAGLLGIAEAFAALPEPPARSVLFLAVSGEEKGLLGSMHFAANPTIPGEGIVANLNMDMIGRNAPDTLIAIGQEYSTFEQVLNEVLAAHPDLGLTVIRDPYPEEGLFFRSDQLSFIQRGVPSLFFFTGLHEDYHQPSDVLERIDADKVARVSRLGFLVAHRVATSSEAPEWTEEGRRQVEQILRGGM
ncbi:M28 family metallopeptidase [soil metagenome]